jgi:hypothetical protein
MQKVGDRSTLIGGPLLVALANLAGCAATGESDWAKAQYARFDIAYEETITVKTYPEGADVYVDEELIGQSPVDIMLMADPLPVFWKFKAGTGHFGPLEVDAEKIKFEQHLLGVTAPGFFQARESLSLEGSPALDATLTSWLPDPEPGSGQARTQVPELLQGKRSLEITLLPQTAAAASTQAPSTGAGALLIKHSDPTAEIFIDGRFVGNAPVSLSLSQGDHKVEVRQQGDTTYARTVSVYGGSSATLNLGN